MLFQGVQQEFAFIPDDGSAAYASNVDSNSTTSYWGSAYKDADLNYATSNTALVQFNRSGYFSYTDSDTSTKSAASWTRL